MKKILIIDDYEPFRFVTAEALRTVPYDVKEAGDGPAGLCLAQSTLPDIIIIDVQMEGMSGYDTLAHLRGNPATANIPVILMTGNPDMTGLRQGMRLGADDYLPKPFSFDELLATVRGRIAKAEGVRTEAEEKLARLRTQIGMMLPHEMLTPLTGILGIADILQANAPDIAPHELAEFAGSIQRSARRLQHLVQNFLIYAQMEIVAGDPARQAELRGSPCRNPEQLIEQQAKTQARLAGRETDLVLSLKPAPIPLSKTYLEKVAEELVNNAFKFSRPGSKVTVQLVPDNGASWFSVADEGFGMKPEFLANIGAYMQFERKIHAQQGTGLGLTIAKRLVELHAGVFTVSSDPGRGTRVAIRFPRTP
jgi:signal transduction histidine kinase